MTLDVVGTSRRCVPSWHGARASAKIGRLEFGVSAKFPFAGARRMAQTTPPEHPTPTAGAVRAAAMPLASRRRSGSAPLRSAKAGWPRRAESSPTEGIEPFFPRISLAGLHSGAQIAFQGRETIRPDTQNLRTLGWAGEVIWCHHMNRKGLSPVRHSRCPDQARQVRVSQSCAGSTSSASFLARSHANKRRGLAVLA